MEPIELSEVSFKVKFKGEEFSLSEPTADQMAELMSAYKKSEEDNDALAEIRVTKNALIKLGLSQSAADLMSIRLLKQLAEAVLYPKK